MWPDPRVAPAAVSRRSADLLHGPSRTASVLARSPFGLYLGVGGTGRVLPLLSADALALPSALRLTTLAARELDWGVAVGGAVTVGGGEVLLPGMVVRAVRTWRPASVQAPSARSRPHDHPGTTPRPGGLPTLALTDALDPALRQEARAVTSAVLGAADPARGVRALVGRGPGLTPSGDDALCGVLLCLAATGPTAAREALAATVRAAAHRTTAVGASLLADAADGCGVREVVRLVDALVAGDHRCSGRLLPAVLALGHSSGADLLAGVWGALDALEALRLDAVDPVAS